MTVVAAHVDGNVVLFASDSAASDESNHSIMTQRSSKLFKKLIRTNDNQLYELVVGFAGSFGMGDCLNYRFYFPTWNRNISFYAYLVAHVIPLFRKYLKKLRNEEKEDGETTQDEFSLLFGFQGKLYVVESNWQVLQPLDPYACIGTGAMPALGALHALRETDMYTWEKLEIAMSAAEQHIMSVRKPWKLDICMSTAC